MFFESWHVVILFVISIFSVVSHKTITGAYVRKFRMKMSEHYLISTSYSTACALTLFILNSFSINLSVFSLVLGIAFGFFISLSQVSTSLALRSGPYGYTNVITYFSTVITALSGFIFFGEGITALKIIGIVFMLACFYFAVARKEGDKKTNLKWFVLALLSMVATSLIGLMQKIHQKSAYKGELASFLLIAFVFSIICSLSVFTFVRIREKKFSGEKEHKLFDSKKHIRIFLISALCCGVFVAFNNVLNLFLSGKVDTAIFFPIVNGIPLMASLLVSLFLFKEKMTKRQWLGIGFGLIGLACLFIK